MSTSFFMPANNILGQGAVDDAIKQIAELGFKKAFIVTDKPLASLGYAQKIVDKLASVGISATIFDEAQANPTVGNVNAGLARLKEKGADCIISLGGGSPHDCAKAIALVATNDGKIEDYEGLDKSPKPALPQIAINTTAGTASEMTRFTIITEEKRHVKMAIVDKHVTPFLSVNDPELMVGMPASLTAATGMDALTHSIESYVSTAANPITDACAVKAIELIAQYLPTAVNEPKNMQARDNMAYAEFLAGMAFNNASLGYVHAMAHQLGGFYNLPHGVCNALLLPHVEKFNQRAVKGRLDEIGDILVANNADLKADDVIGSIEKLSALVGIPKSLSAFDVVKKSDFPTLAENAMKDVCGLTNPVQPTKEEVIGIFEAAY